MKQNALTILFSIAMLALFLAIGCTEARQPAPIADTGEQDLSPDNGLDVNTDAPKEVVC